MATSTSEAVTIDDVRAAATRIAGEAVRTPLLPQSAWDLPEGTDLYLKAENLQRTGAFKFRGAYNTLATMVEAGETGPVVTSSSGNHGQAVAAAGRILGIAVTVVMPEDAVAVKVEAVRGFGARIEFAGTTSTERSDRADAIGRDTGATVIGSFDDARIIAGQGTCGLELMEQLPDVEMIVVPVGGGGLISGVATAAKAMRPDVTIVGVEPAGASDGYQSLSSGRLVTAATIETIADGLRTSHLGHLNFAIMSQLVDRIVLVSDDEIRSAMRALALNAKLAVEPSGAVAVAAILNGRISVEGKQVVAVISGGNVDPAMFSNIIGGSQ
ncbi:MAG TPA: threonine/serine dehydratase [Chloroflexota bacterium]|nr:threonine/serine dehydratase [Chloroflexota bacterium]